MNMKQSHKASVALANTSMVKDMNDGELTRQFYSTRSMGDNVMCDAIRVEQARRGQRLEKARAYFNTFKSACSNEQLDRISAKFELYGSLAVMAEAELVARCDWSL